jgi:energy-converting hydrogenase B subunit D
VPLQSVAIALAALGAPAVVLVRDPLKQIVLSGFYGWSLVVLFVVLGAPDVALSMLVVGTVGYPLVVLVAIARIRSDKGRGGEE